MTFGGQSDELSEEELEEIAEAMVFAFGHRGPLDWAGELHNRLMRGAARLAAARAHSEDQKRDSTDELEAEAKTQVRLTATDFLAEIYQMLKAMPLFEEQPEILDALKFIITEIASVEKGATPSWLIATPSKRHFKNTTKEAEWVPIIMALELLITLPEFSNQHAASTAIADATGRPLGTIKHWHRKLYNGGKSGRVTDFERPYAASQIRSEVHLFMDLRNYTKPYKYQTFVVARVQELLR